MGQWSCVPPLHSGSSTLAPRPRKPSCLLTDSSQLLLPIDNSSPSATTECSSKAPPLQPIRLTKRESSPTMSGSGSGSNDTPRVMPIISITVPDGTSSSPSITDQPEGTAVPTSDICGSVQQARDSAYYATIPWNRVQHSVTPEEVEFGWGGSARHFRQSRVTPKRSASHGALPTNWLQKEAVSHTHFADVGFFFPFRLVYLVSVAHLALVADHPMVACNGGERCERSRVELRRQ